MGSSHEPHFFCNVVVLVEGVEMILDKVKASGLQALCIVLLALLCAQTWRLHAEQLAHGRLQTQVSQADTGRATAALRAERRNAGLNLAHAQQTLENSDAFTTSQPIRDALARVDRAVAERLHLGAERRAATYRAMAETNAAACRDLADRHAALDAHVVRGVEVVAGLRGDLVRRDAEVVLLRRQIDTDRALLDDASHE